jgi:hypothetical protein
MPNHSVGVHLSSGTKHAQVRSDLSNDQEEAKVTLKVLPFNMLQVLLLRGVSQVSDPANSARDRS